MERATVESLFRKSFLTARLGVQELCSGAQNGNPDALDEQVCYTFVRYTGDCQSERIQPFVCLGEVNGRYSL